MKKFKDVHAFILLIIIAGVARLVPHIPNFTPVEGVTLFGGAYMVRRHLTWILPVVMLFITDFILNNTINRVFFTDHTGLVFFSNYMIYVFISVILISFIGRWIISKVTVYRVLGAALISSVLFFIITNFGVWLHSTTFYTKDLTGLIQCYIAAWPFFRTTLLSNILFVSLLFGGYEMLKKYIPALYANEA